MKTLIKNGRVLDPATKKDGIYDVLIEDGIIKEVEQNLIVEVDNIIDATGCFVMPGLIDLHVHFREPGFEHKETIRTGARAAAKGGFTTVCAMPNTRPVVDNLDTLKFVIDKAKEVTKVNVLPIAAITAGQEGEFLTDIEKLFKNGAVAISEDGKSVMNARVCRQAMRLAAEVGVPVFAHCEDKDLAARGVLNAGDKAKELGVYGIMNIVEDSIVARDILIAKNTGAQLHLCHCSTQDSVKMVALAKKEGLPVTAEVCPHHFAMSEDDITSDDANFKMNPPLRSRKDMEALRLGLKNDIMDVIATDHAPHHVSEKNVPLDEAPFGITGLETAVSLTITALVDTGYITPMQIAEKMSYNPAKIIGLDKGTLLPGKIADITIINPDIEYIIDSSTFVSLGKNTPFNGKKVKGKVMATIVAGEVIYSAEAK
ncbi:dihydroorotase [[Clostridium] fimetarium]|uniref:Dihydroorotase n=1 Tax=[Clostridium] fimetarium TaxID=99656 RepID=A0A1I0R3P1_9FIRM|nr:dihydroorotase [[Clostridium] fimetarium]SEW34878.1 dihydroorotase [[Clostridium] fimetarium]